MIELYVSRKLFKQIQRVGVWPLDMLQADMAYRGMKEVKIKLFDTDREDNVLWIKEDGDGVPFAERFEEYSELVSGACVKILEKKDS